PQPRPEGPRPAHQIHRTERGHDRRQRRSSPRRDGRGGRIDGARHQHQGLRDAEPSVAGRANRRGIRADGALWIKEQRGAVASAVGTPKLPARGPPTARRGTGRRRGSRTRRRTVPQPAPKIGDLERERFDRRRVEPRNHRRARTPSSNGGLSQRAGEHAETGASVRFTWAYRRRRQSRDGTLAEDRNCRRRPRGLRPVEFARGRTASRTRGGPRMSADETQNEERWAVAHVFASFNNTIISITDQTGA